MGDETASHLTDEQSSLLEHSRSSATRAIHADDFLNTGKDVAPPMHVSTTFRYEEDPEKLEPFSQWNKDLTKPPANHLYSRLSAPTQSRLEAILSSICGGRAITYTSGLSSFHALLTFLNPSRIVIGEGYHGCLGVVRIHQKLNPQLQQLDLHAADEDWDAAGLGKGDIVHVETPLNPTGEVYDLASFAERAHRRGAYLTVDATFGPPPLQDPFAQGADVVMHSGTKYIGGHSDMLCGVLVVRNHDWWWQLYRERLLLGGVMGSLEGWLGVRSMRTLELRVQRQSENATELVGRLHTALTGRLSPNVSTSNGVMSYNCDVSRIKVQAEQDLIRATVHSIKHASIQFGPKQPPEWLRKQMPNGYGPVFALYLKSASLARRFPSKVELFHHATSLGGVESLIEWRRMTDERVDERMLRVSVGVEGVEDLWADILSGLEALRNEDPEAAAPKRKVEEGTNGDIKRQKLALS